MIQASQSQTKTKKANLEIHKEITKHRFWEKKLLISSLISLAVVFVLWLVAVPLLYRLAIFALAFLLSLALKVENSYNWAFSWIAKSIGLSYETALELNQDDPYLLNQAVIKRAKTLSIKLEKPKQNFWWLPILALAIGFAVLPFSPFNGSKILSALNPKASSNTTTEISNSADISQESDANLEENPQLDSLDQDQAPNNDNQLEQEQNQGLSDGASEDETLSDYMDSIKQRDKSQTQSNDNKQTPKNQEQEAQNPFNSVREPTDDPNASQQSGSQQSEGQEQDQNAQQSNSSQQSTSPSDNQQESNAEKREGDSSADGQEQGENQQNKSTDNKQEQNQEEQSNLPSSDGSDNNESSQPQDQGQNNGDQQSTNPQDPQGDQALGEGEKGQDGVGKDPTAETQGRGNPDIIEAPQSEPDFVEGQLKQGDSNQAGTVRLAGNQDNTGSTANNKAIFNRSQEEAISEGSIPLEYQEIIRNYFR